MDRLSLLVALLAGLLSLLPSLAVLAVATAVAWVGGRFVIQLVQLLMS